MCFACWPLVVLGYVTNESAVSLFGDAPTCACLQDRSLSKSGTKTWKGAIRQMALAFGTWHSRVLLLDDDRMKWCSHEDLHLEPPPSHGGVHYSYTLRASNLVRHVGVAPT